MRFVGSLAVVVGVFAAVVGVLQISGCLELLVAYRIAGKFGGLAIGEIIYYRL